MKLGANITDQNAIARMFNDGDDAEYISNQLQIDIDVVTSFSPTPKEAKGKNKLAEKFDK